MGVGGAHRSEESRRKPEGVKGPWRKASRLTRSSWPRAARENLSVRSNGSIFAVVAGNNKPEAAPTPDKVLNVGTTMTKCRLAPLTSEADALRQAGIRNLSFVPPEVMPQFVEVGRPNFAKKDGPLVICSLSQRLDKEGDPRHLIGLSRRPL
jgi:hypothetical protein